MKIGYLFFILHIFICSAHLESLKSSVDVLRKKLVEFAELHNSQQELINTLKAEGLLLSQTEAELRDAKKRLKELKAYTEEQEEAIFNLRKVRYYSIVFKIFTIV